MKASFLIAIALLSAVAAPAQAQEEPKARPGGARFVFEPNRYGSERGSAPRSSHYSGPVGTVSHGAMPKGSNFLGVSPDIFKKPAPAPQMQANVYPRLVPQQQPAPFQNVFGSPIIAQKPMTASPMTMSSVPAPKSTPVRSSTRVAARPITSRRPTGSVAHAKPIASYSSGFNSGSTMPTSGGGISSTSEVRGKLLPK